VYGIRISKIVGMKIKNGIVEITTLKQNEKIYERRAACKNCLDIKFA
tara:strand:- start:528 stop:668 length:141 start_codon:yes stop_codon:yes gene_type:complete